MPGVDDAGGVAAFFAHFWLGTEFVFLDCVGLVLIISSIFLLEKKGRASRYPTKKSGK